MDNTITADVTPLFRTFPFGEKTLRNRLVMSPMTRQYSPGGVPGANMAGYYRRRAEGGVGLIVTEGTCIDHPGSNGYVNVPAFHGQKALDEWKRIADEVHLAGARIIPQLWHVGAIRRPGMEPDPAVPGHGPVEVIENGRVVVKAMSRSDIRDVVESYARAAADAQRIGFDGIEIHGAHEYLIDSFLWDVTNQRDDEYGGDIEGRLRLAREVVAAVRAAVTRDFPIVFRFSQWKIRDYEARIARSPDELRRILLPLAQAGVDIFDVSTRRFYEPAFEGSPDSLAAWARRLSGKPVITVGSVGLSKAYAIAQLRGNEDASAQRAELSLVCGQVRSGAVDLVALGRALLADPEWPSKIRENRQSEINDVDRAALKTAV
jgi:2,4-dienoyl-CoA reductase-like NADH-dependent reductase (Old Yellow Enzyme family)